MDELREASVKDAAFERQPWELTRVTSMSAFSHFERAPSSRTRRGAGGASAAGLASLLSCPRIPALPLLLEHAAGKHLPARTLLPGPGHAHKGDWAGPASLH